MRHTRAEVIERTEVEFGRLDRLLAGLTDDAWARPLPRPETKDPWTVKDAVAHITHWKANAARVARRQRPPPEERGLDTNAGNHLVYVRWRDRPPAEVLAWHRATQADVLAALNDVPDAWFDGRERGPQWPYDLDAHSVWHRQRDIERTLAAP